MVAQVLSGVEDTLTSMLDNSLLAFATAQLMIANDTYPVPAALSVSAIRIGSRAYIEITAAINFIIILVCILEPVRTQGWKDLSTFDPTDTKSVTISASRGGSRVAEEARKLLERKGTGRVDDADAGNIKAQLEGQGEDIRLVGVSEETGSEKGTRRIWRKKVPTRDTETEALTITAKSSLKE